MAHLGQHLRLGLGMGRLERHAAHVANRFGDRPPHVFAVGDALPCQHVRTPVEVGVLRHLGREAALPDTGVTGDEHQVRVVASECRVDDVAQQGELGVATDE